MKLGAAAQAKSRTFFALNRHVRVGVGLRPEDRGRVKDWPTSAFVMMGTVVSDLSAVARRGRGGGGGTPTPLNTAPPAATPKLAGTGGPEPQLPYPAMNYPQPAA